MTTRQIELIDVVTGKPFPAAQSGQLLASSAPLGWRGIVVDWHRLDPQELPEHYLDGYGLSVSTGKQPIRFGWKEDDDWHHGPLMPGECHLLTHGAINSPRWLDPFEAVSLVLDRRFVANLIEDGLPVADVELTILRSVCDPVVARYAEGFRSELAAGVPSGTLYVETLAVGFALHLLANYAVAKPRLPRPRGKLSSLQLRSVVDFIQSHLDQDLSLSALAERANVSSFHFARSFRSTVGVSPHQFVLRQRIQQALVLIQAGKLPLAQIALACGFHDQAHLTHAFRKAFGRTPARGRATH